MARRAVVFGGTRFIGRALVEALAAGGWRVALVSRGRTRPALPAGVEAHWGERSDPEVLGRVFREPADAVLDNIAYAGRDVASLAPFAARMGRYLLTSTAWVYLALAASPSPFREEQLRPGSASGAVRPGLPEATRAYVAGKLAAETAAFGLGSPVTVLRPCMVGGAGDPHGRVAYYARRALAGAPVPPRPGRRVQLLWVGDLTAAVAGLLDREPPARSVWNVAPPDPVELDRVAAWAAEAAGRPTAGAGVPEGDEPLALAFDDLYDGGGLAGALPDFAFTPASEWVAETAREAASPPKSGGTAVTEQRA